jgi:hypothetical protein
MNDRESEDGSRQDAKSAKKNFFYLSELGALCAFARVVFSPP